MTDSCSPANGSPPHAPSPQPIHVVLDNLRSAFNVGSVFRTGDACGIAHLYLCGMTACPPHPRLERTALGAAETVPWSYHSSAMDALDRLDRLGIPAVAIEVGPDARPYHRFDWPRPVALVLGHETRGLSADVARRCRAQVCLPMLGAKSSLNVATAAGVLLYDIVRRWDAFDTPRSAPGAPFALP